MSAIKNNVLQRSLPIGMNQWSLLGLGLAGLLPALLAVMLCYLAPNQVWLHGLGVGAATMALLVMTLRWIARREQSSRRPIAQWQDQSEWLQGLFNALNDPVILIDEQQHWRLVNDACCSVLGQTREELLGKPGYDVLPKHETDVFGSKGDEELTTGQQNISEATLTDARGNPRIMITKKTRLTDNAGQHYLVVISRDVTRERDLQAWRSRYERAALTRRLVLYEYDPLNNKGLYGGAIEEVLGCTAPLTGKLEWWLECVHPEDRDKFYHFVQQTLNGDDEQQLLLYRMIRQDGKRIVVEDHNYAEKDDKGRVVRVIGSIADVTDRVQEQEALRDNEEWLRVTQEAAGIGTWDWSIATDTARYSRAHLLMYGLPPENERVTYQQWMQTIHPEDRQRVQEELQHAIQSGNPYRTEFRIVWPNGSIHWINNSGKLLYDENRQPVRMIGAAFEITDRKRIEEVLRRSHERLEQRILRRTAKLRRANEDLRREKEVAQRYLDTINVMVIVLNQQGRVTLINRKGCELLEGTEAEIVGCDWFDHFIPPEQRSEVRTLFASIMRQELSPVLGYDNFVITRSGKRCLIRWSNNSITNAQGAITGVISSGEDITEQKRAEQALRVSEQRIRAIGDNLPEGMLYQVARNPNGEYRFTYLSAGVERLSGHNAQAVMADPRLLYDLVEEQDRAKLRRLEEESWRDLQTLNVEIRKRLQSGEDRWSRIISHPRRLEDGSTVWDGIEFDITDLKRTEEALRRSESLLLATNRIAKVGGWELDLHTNALFWTDEIKRIHDLPLDYKPVLEEGIKFYAPEHIPVIQRAVEGAMAGKSYDVELQIITAKKNRLWVRAIGQPIIENGEVVKLRGVFQDIHARKLAEDALKRSEANLREAQTLAKLGNFEFDLQTQAIQWSDEAYRIFGLEVGTPISLERYASLLDPDKFKEVMDAVEQSVATHKPYHIEHHVSLWNGVKKHLFAIGRPEVGDDGQVKRIFGTVQDITARKHAEESLKLTQFAIDSSSDAAFWMGPDGRFIYVNNASCRTLGYTQQELLTMSVFDVDAEFPRENWAMHWSELREKRAFTLETTHKSKEGLVFPVEVHVNYLEFGGREYNCAFARDITERKRTEERVLNSLREKEVLLKEIHHRVKNNLQIISSLLDLQSYAVEDEQMQTIFRESQNRVRSMAIIHEQLYQANDLARIDMARYVEELTEYLLRSYGAGNEVVTVQIEIPAVLLSIDTVIPCGLIINELFTNSLKYAFPNHRSGFIRIALEASDAERLILRIADNGVGLPAELNIEQSASLGLMIVKTLVQQLRGTLAIDCCAGTSYTITFSEVSKRNSVQVKDQTGSLS